MAWIVQFDTQMLKDGYTPTEAMVYGYMRWTSWKTREYEFRPSIGLMSKSLCISRRAIVYAINTLEADGLIEVFRSYKSKNTYVICDMRNYPAINNFDEKKIGGETKRDKMQKKFQVWQKHT